MQTDADSHLPDLHDGNLLAVGVMSGGLQLTCETAGGDTYRLSLTQVRVLRMDNFLEGNIISEVQVMPAGKAQESLLLWVYAPYGSANPIVTKEMTLAREENWTLLSLTTSYGCELVALATGEFVNERQARH